MSIYTANFRGTYACVAELPSTGNTNNDYAFVCSLNTTTGNYIYDRYKYLADFKAKFYVNNIVLLLNGRNDLLLLQKPHSNSS